MGQVIGAIWQGIKWLAGKAAELAIIIAKATAAAAKYVWKGLRILGDWSWEAAKWVVTKGIPWILDQIDKALKAIEGLLGKLGDWLQKKLPGLFKAIKWIFNLWDKLSKLVLKVVSIIQLFRLIFKTLGKLGIKWAKSVDRWLYGLEQKIWQAFEWVRSWVTWSRSWINLLADPRGLLRYSTFMHSLKQFHREAWGVLISIGVTKDRKKDNEEAARKMKLLDLQQSLQRGLEMGGILPQNVIDAEETFRAVTAGK